MTLQIKPLSLDYCEKALVKFDQEIDYAKIYVSILYWIEKKKDSHKGEIKPKNEIR